MQAMTIGGLAQTAGVGVETVRFYQRRGLLRVPDRPGSGIAAGVRRYDAADLRQLRFIRSAQAAGFTLEQIAELQHLDVVQDRARARQLARERLASLGARIRELEEARAMLQRLAAECGSSAEGPCPIIEAFTHTEAE